MCFMNMGIIFQVLEDQLGELENIVGKEHISLNSLKNTQNRRYAPMEMDFRIVKFHFLLRPI